MLQYTGELRIPEIKKRISFFDTIEPIKISEDYFELSKKIHNAKNEARDVFDKTSKRKRKNNYIHSTKHSEEELFLGILSEFMVAIKYGVQEEWVKDQRNQISLIQRTGRFDITDVGKTQIRAVDYKPWQMMSIIMRPADIENKKDQPTVGCVICPNEMWIKICGWATMELAEKFGDVGDPNGRGNCIFLSPCKLYPMNIFDVENFKY